MPAQRLLNRRAVQLSAHNSPIEAVTIANLAPQDGRCESRETRLVHDPPTSPFAAYA